MMVLSEFYFVVSCMGPSGFLVNINCFSLDLLLQAEGIFRINAENGQEESVRDQLNRGIVPEGVDVHCLAGLIKV